MTENFTYTECPSCGSTVYDNREENKKRVAQGEKARPEFACKEKCGWLKWAPRPAGQSRSGGFSKAPAVPRWKSYDDLEMCYHKCMSAAVKRTNKLAEATGLKPTFADYLSCTATLFISASRDKVASEAKANG